MKKPFAVLLNFTAGSYHWGCYATSMEIYDTLVERGYCVTTVGVEAIYRLTPVPAADADFDDTGFANRFFNSNPVLFDALRDADRIVVNGEGTLHGDRPAARNLLYLMYAARKYLNRDVHLINHSFYPSGGLAPAAVDHLYGGVARVLRRVVPREEMSAGVLRRLGVSAMEQGFDCLPRFVARHGLTGAHGGGGPVVLAGGVSMTEPQARLAARAAAEAGGRNLCFLTGARVRPAAEDAPVFQWMREEAPGLELVDAPDARTWLETIGGAAVMVSARFHHTVAALTLGTPVVAMPGNTPKTGAVCAMLGMTPPLAPPPETDASGDFAAGLRLRLRDALDGGCVLAPADRSRMAEMAALNFADL